MIVTVWILMALLPFVLGMGVQCLIGLFQGKKTPFRYYFTDAWLMGEMISLMIGGACHLMGAYGGFDLTEVQKSFWVAMTVCCVLAMVFVVMTFTRKMFFTQLQTKKEDRSFLMALWFLLIFAFEAIFIFCVEPVKVPGDITLETVKSFLSTDAIYSVNPLTGREYMVGLSDRVKMLELPTLYAVLAKTFQLDASELIRNMIPIVVLSASMMAYYRLARMLFGERGKWNYLFLFFILVIFLFGDQAEFLPGYQALHSGYLGESIRNNVLIPLAMSVLLELFSFRDLRQEKKARDLLLKRDAATLNEKEKAKAQKVQAVKEQENKRFVAEINKRSVFPVVILLSCIVTEVFLTPTFYGVGMTLVLAPAATVIWWLYECASNKFIGKKQEEAE